MRTIGLLGGMSWESSLEYYRIINQTMKNRLGNLHSARCLLFSFDFASIEALQHAGDWEVLTEMLIEGVHRLERGGADCLVICTNTMHRLADKIESATKVPLLHIADATAEAIHLAGISKVGLLGTRFTMEGDFYRGKLEKDHNLTVLIPDEGEKEIVHRVIYNELVQGKIRQSSKRAYLAVMANLQSQGAEGVILGCTEISLLVKQSDTPIPVFDTTTLHAQAAVDFALSET